MSFFRGLQEEDPSQASNSDFVFRPIHPIKSNSAFNQHRCDEDDMEGRFKKIVVSPFAETLEEKQTFDRRPAAPPQVAHNNNTNGGAGKWEGKQSGRNGNYQL